MMKKIIIAAIAAAAAVSAAHAAGPSFPGGEAAMKEFITANLKYPEAARDNGIEGIVTVQFTVRPDGSVGSIKIARMIDPDLEQEAIRLVKTMPAWVPADNAGTAVEAPAEVSITFTLPE